MGDDVTPVTPTDRASEAGEGGPPTTWWGATRTDCLLTGLVALLVLILTGVGAVHFYGWGAGPVVLERSAQWEGYRLDVNSATWVELMQVEGLGETLARRIVEYRDGNGPFTSLDELTAVRGIGEKVLERIRPSLRVGEAAASESPQADAATSIEGPL